MIRDTAIIINSITNVFVLVFLYCVAAENLEATLQEVDYLIGKTSAMSGGMFLSLPLKFYKLIVGLRMPLLIVFFAMYQTVCIGAYLLSYIPTVGDTIAVLLLIISLLLAFVVGVHIVIFLFAWYMAPMGTEDNPLLKSRLGPFRSSNSIEYITKMLKFNKPLQAMFQNMFQRAQE